MKSAPALVAILCALVLAGGSSVSAGASGGGIPLSAYGALSTISHIVVSPDGDRIAVLVRDAGGNQLQIRNVSDGGVAFATSVGNAKVRGLTWAGNHHLLITSSTTQSLPIFVGDKEEYNQVSDLDVDQHKLHSLLGDIQSGLSIAHSKPIVIYEGGAPKVFVEAPHFERTYGTLGVYSVDLSTDRSFLVIGGSSHTYGFVVNAHGDVIAREDYESRKGVWRLFLRDGSGWKLNREIVAPLDPPYLGGMGRTDGTILVSQHSDHGDLTYEVSTATGVWSAPLDDLKNADVIDDPVSRIALGGYRTSLQEGDYTFFSAEDTKTWQAVVKAFPDEEVKLASWSNDRRKLALKVTGKTHGDAFYYVDLTTGSAYLIANEYSPLDAGVIAPRQSIHYAAADGLDIPAYLTLPLGKPLHSLPLIVLVHGGPVARDEPGFAWWPQALASRGYAVLQPQYRGSDGLGAKLLEAGYGQWGREMQTDLSDGVRALVARGVVDPSRVCIMGAGYGGYAALAGAAFDGRVYRCAVAVAGQADLLSQFRFENDNGLADRSAGMRQWQRLMGAKSAQDHALDDISPARHADKINIPVLLIHGQDDTVVPYDQSRRMAEALQRAGKTFKMVTLKGEDHWLSHGDTRTQMLQASVDFLERYNPPGAIDATPEAPGQSRTTAAH